MRILTQSRLSPNGLLCSLVSILPFISYTAAVGLAASFKAATYVAGDSIPVSCLNRTIDTGEHVEVNGVLQYVPFLTCSETKKPLALTYLSEIPLNCTIEALSDETFHLWEFYVHHDSPLACRVPARPSTGDVELAHGPGVEAGEWIPFVISLAGKLERSHLHISTSMNVIFHTSLSEDGDEAPGTIDSATAYSISSLTSSTRIVIGDPLPLKFSIRWYAGTNLPASDGEENDWGQSRSNGEHVTIHTLVYCLLTAGCTAIGCTAWFLGVEFPKRLRRARAGGTLGGYASLGVQGLNGAGGGLTGVTVGPGKPGGYGLPASNSGAEGSWGGGWVTKKD